MALPSSQAVASRPVVALCTGKSDGTVTMLRLLLDHHAFLKPTLHPCGTSRISLSKSCCWCTGYDWYDVSPLPCCLNYTTTGDFLTSPSLWLWIMDKNAVSEHVLCIHRRTKYGAHGDTFFLGCHMEWGIDVGRMSTNTECRAGQHSKLTNSRQHEQDYCAAYLQSDPVMPPPRKHTMLVLQ